MIQIKKGRVTQKLMPNTFRILLTSHSEINAEGTWADHKASRAMDGASRAVMDDVFCVFMSGPCSCSLRWF